MNDNSRSLSAHQPIPLLIGVTGHRDLRAVEIPEIERAVEGFFVKLRADFSDLPLCVLGGLAEGADSLVAGVAHRLGISVINVLPMPREQYQLDFADDARTEFDRLCDLAPTIELPLQTSLPVEGAARALHYEQLGVYLAAHSHLLLALWDGKLTGSPGGTGEVVNFHMNDTTVLADASQHRDRLDVSDDESDLVYQIVCGRRSTGEPPSEFDAGSTHWLTRDQRDKGSNELPARYRVVLGRLAEFNRDCASVSGKKNAGGESLLPEADQELPPGLNTLARIQHLFSVCDSLAGTYQRRTLMALRTTLASALAAGLAFILYADFDDFSSMIWAYLVCAGLSVASYLLAARQQWQRKHLDYRVLAEALRVQYYWALAGVPMTNPSRYSHDSFFQGRDLDLGWIRNVMRYTGLHPPIQAGSAKLQAAIQHWVGGENSGQLGYYSRSSGRKMRQLKTTDLVTRLCFAGGLVVALLLAIVDESLDGISTNVLLAFMGLLPLLAAGRQSYSHRLAERELVAQYAHMSEIFGHADRLLKAAPDDQDRRDLLRELGEAALYENAQWLLRQRNRPLPGGDAMT